MIDYGTSFGILRLSATRISLLSHWGEEKFGRKRLIVAPAIGFAFELRGRLVLELSGCARIRQLYKNSSELTLRLL